MVARVVIVVASGVRRGRRSSGLGCHSVDAGSGHGEAEHGHARHHHDPGHRLLRYTAVMVNIGAGRLEVRGSRPDTFSQMTVKQRIYNTGGGHTDRVTSIAMQYAGDGHEHWHSLDMEGGTLAHLDSGGTVSALAKHGFCFSTTSSSG